jgi:hypothetical protein
MREAQVFFSGFVQNWNFRVCVFGERKETFVLRVRCRLGLFSLASESGEVRDARGMKDLSRLMTFEQLGEARSPLSERRQLPRPDTPWNVG